VPECCIKGIAGKRSADFLPLLHSVRGNIDAGPGGYVWISDLGEQAGAVNPKMLSNRRTGMDLRKTCFSDATLPDSICGVIPPRA